MERQIKDLVETEKAMTGTCTFRDQQLRPWTEVGSDMSEPFVRPCPKGEVQRTERGS